MYSWEWMSTTNWNWLKVGFLVCMSPLGLLCLPTLVSFSIIHMHCCFCFSFYLLWASLHHSHFHYLMLMFLYLNECLILIICCLAAVLFVDCDCEIRDCRFAGFCIELQKLFFWMLFHWKLDVNYDHVQCHQLLWFGLVYHFEQVDVTIEYTNEHLLWQWEVGF